MKTLFQTIVLTIIFTFPIQSFSSVSSIDGYKGIKFGMSIDKGYEVLKKCKDGGGCKQSITLLSNKTSTVTGISVDYGKYNIELFKRLKKAIKKKYNKTFMPNECDKNDYDESIDKWEILRLYMRGINNIDDQVMRMEQESQGSTKGILGMVLGMMNVNIYLKELGPGFANNQVWLLITKKLDMETSMKFKKNPELWEMNEHIVVEYSIKDGIGQDRYNKFMESVCHQELDV